MPRKFKSNTSSSGSDMGQRALGSVLRTLTIQEGNLLVLNVFLREVERCAKLEEPHPRELTTIYSLPLESMVDFLGSVQRLAGGFIEDLRQDN